MARPILLTLFLLLPVSLRAEEPPPPEENDIVPKGAKLELLYTRSDNVKGGLTEGPAAAPDGSIYFSDIRLGKDKSKIMRFDPKTKKTTVFTDDSGKSNGLKFDAQGYLIACEGSDEGGEPRPDDRQREGAHLRATRLRIAGRRYGRRPGSTLETGGRRGAAGRVGRPHGLRGLVGAGNPRLVERPRRPLPQRAREERRHGVERRRALSDSLIEVAVHVRHGELDPRRRRGGRVVQQLRRQDEQALQARDRRVVLGAHLAPVLVGELHTRRVQGCRVLGDLLPDSILPGLGISCLGAGRRAR